MRSPERDQWASFGTLADAGEPRDGLRRIRSATRERMADVVGAAADGDGTSR